MGKKNEKDENLRITLVIGFIGILLTSLYIFKEFYADKEGVIIEFLKIFLNLYGLILVIFFLIFLLLTATSLRYRQKTKSKEIIPILNAKEFFYDTTTGNFGYYVKMALLFVFARYAVEVLKQYLSLSGFWLGAIAGIIFMLVYTLLGHLCLKFFSKKRPKSKGTSNKKDVHR